MRAFALALMLAAFAFGAPARAAEKPPVTLYKTATCGCCKGYAEHMKALGYPITVIDHADLSTLKRRLGVEPRLESCHTMKIGSYVVEGHVPETTIARLLTEKPAIKGIALPGMPLGTPGMSGPKEGPYIVEVIGTKKPTVFAVE
ncbi:MAG: DUF411 domain-containing protein [Alphaproteobacteria bacterium]|nr:DUF411 domain-containing protein [Alphaproteobacteria bacterium]